jgi:hypothetical protein
LKNILIPKLPIIIQEQIINKIEQLNLESSHYETYARILETEITNIIETIKNMLIINKSDIIIKNLGLNEIPNYNTLINETDIYIYKGFKFLRKLNNESDNSNDSNDETNNSNNDSDDNNILDDTNINKVAKIKNYSNYR